MGPAGRQQAAGGHRRAERRSRSWRRPQRSTSAMRRLNQFMNSEVTRLIVRYTSMVMAITSTACPVWLSTVPANTSTRSGYPTKTASEEFLVRFKYWLVSGGMFNALPQDTKRHRDTPRGLTPREAAPLALLWRTQRYAA